MRHTKKNNPKLVCMCVHVYVAYEPNAKRTLFFLHSRLLLFFFFIVVAAVALVLCSLFYFGYVLYIQISTAAAAAAAVFLIDILNWIEGFSLIQWAHFDGLVCFFFSFISTFPNHFDIHIVYYYFFSLRNK